ncbi:hypothetical protein ACK34T_05635, partial [Aeromonas veronii]
AEQSRAEQSRAEQSRAEQSRAEQSRAEIAYCGIGGQISAQMVGGGDATSMSLIYISLAGQIARREPEAPFFVSGNVMAAG